MFYLYNMEQKQSSIVNQEYTNSTDILHLFKLGHIQLDVTLKNLKNRIDR